MSEQEITKKWMEDNKMGYLEECEDAADAMEYMIEDCNSECDTDLDDDELRIIAKEVLGLE